MILAEVTGTVVGQEMTDWIKNPVFLIVEEVDATGKRIGDGFVVYDPLGAKRGEVVLVSQGSSVRQTEDTKDRPVDAIVAGIADIVERGGKDTYRKDS